MTNNYTSQFKTKTEIKEANNGGIKGVWPIAIDVGYSSVKVFSPNSTGIFPSFAQVFEPEIVGTLPKTSLIYKDLDTGNTWLVGEAAQNNVEQDNATISEEAVFGRARYDDPMFLVILRTGLALGHRQNQFGTPDDKPIYVQSGLPPKYLKTDTNTLKNIIAGRHHFSLRIGNAPEEVFDFTIEKSHIDIMAQPTGTLFSVATDNSHHFVKNAGDFFNKNVLIFDAGFGTLDIFPIRNNVVQDKQTFPEYGMRQVLNRTIKKIYEEYNTEVSLIGIQTCLGNGFVRCHDKWKSHNEPFSDMLDEANREVCDEALERIGQIYSLYEYEYFVITGGTGAAWNELIRDKLSGIEGLKVVAGNQNDTNLPFTMANVRGYYMYMYKNVRELLKKNRV